MKTRSEHWYLSSITAAELREMKQKIHHTVLHPTKEDIQLDVEGITLANLLL